MKKYIEINWLQDVDIIQRNVLSPYFYLDNSQVLILESFHFTNTLIQYFWILEVSLTNVTNIHYAIWFVLVFN